MEWVIILAIFAAYSSICSKLDKIINTRQVDNKKSFPSLNELIGKNININISDPSVLFLENETKGILKEFNDKWIVIENINKKELYYYRLNNIVSIDVIEE